jgi:hypothetical protein
MRSGMGACIPFVRPILPEESEDPSLTRNPLTWLIPILMFSGLFYLLRNITGGSKVLPRQWEAEAPESEQPFGIRILMWMSLLTGILGILGVFFPYPFSLSKYAPPENLARHAASIVFSISFLPLFLGIRQRLAVAWKFGWVLLVVSFSWALAESLDSLREQPDSGGWIAYAAVTIGFSFVAIYWGRWWYRQKRYFSRAGL